MPNSSKVVGTMDLLEGRVGNLTPQQESKLAEMWAVMLRKCGSSDDSTAAVATADAHQTSADVEMTPAETRSALWSMVQVEHPDALLLRFLRARKWDVEKAVAMLLATLHWRTKVVHVEQILREGEALAHEQETSTTTGDDAIRKSGKEFMFQMRAGKCVVRGVDKDGRPVCIVRVRQHFSRDQSEEVLKRWIVYIIETARLAFTPPCDTAAVIFDLTGFGMGNLDYVPVKFIIQCFEANYPEMLGKVIVHKAPWFFPGIWKLVSTWIADPVIASKICFSTNAKDLGQYMDPERLPKELGGKDPWEYAYLEPEPDENAKMRETAERDQLLVARESLAKEFEEATRQWLKSPKDEAIKSRRHELAVQINKENYWLLDPYIRARTLWDRLGIRTPDGRINYFPEKVANGKS
ncbi:CRAL-TRIO domain-containing protein [Apiospora rasikravindrae]|uniref:CRAL-TRIO domain-containing protein n=1 Tax=Apiospora rasikravindrae TaxID=990691 RepID=A0ABR1TEL5_9PEZI